MSCADPVCAVETLPSSESVRLLVFDPAMSAEERQAVREMGGSCLQTDKVSAIDAKPRPKMPRASKSIVQFMAMTHVFSHV